jgi:hypothetical protein
MFDVVGGPSVKSIRFSFNFEPPASTSHWKSLRTSPISTMADTAIIMPPQPAPPPKKKSSCGCCTILFFILLILGPALKSVIKKDQQEKNAERMRTRTHFPQAQAGPSPDNVRMRNYPGTEYYADFPKNEPPQIDSTFDNYGHNKY